MDVEGGGRLVSRRVTDEEHFEPVVQFQPAVLALVFGRLDDGVMVHHTLNARLCHGEDPASRGVSVNW